MIPVWIFESSDQRRKVNTRAGRHQGCPATKLAFYEADKAIVLFSNCQYKLHNLSKSEFSLNLINVYCGINI